MKNWVIILLALLLYVVVASALLYAAYWISPPISDTEYKEFGVRAGIALTAAGAFVGVFVSLFTLTRQTKTAETLAEKNREILLSVENRKKEILAEIEKLKGKVARQNEILTRSLDAKSTAYDKLFVASNHCYRELQKLAKGQYDKKAVKEAEKSLTDAEGLSANLEAEDQAIVSTLVQIVMNIIDSAEAIEAKDPAKTAKYEQIWNQYVAELGQALEALRARSIFKGEAISELE